jgi:hypothetical protein
VTTGRTSYELLVGRHVSPATLATFPVALVPTAVPRHSVYRLRVGADHDIAEIVRRLTECDVALLEIRCCPAPRPPPPSDAEPSTAAEPVQGHAGVLVPFQPTGFRTRRRGSAPEGGRSVVPFSPQPDAGGRRGRRPNPPGARG